MSNSTTQSTKPVQRPVYRKMLPGGVSSAVFENQRDGRVYRSINLQRSYRKDNEWKRMGIYFDHEDLPFAIEALSGALTFLNDFRSSSIPGADAAQGDVEETASEELESAA